MSVADNPDRDGTLVYDVYIEEGRLPDKREVVVMAREIFEQWVTELSQRRAGTWVPPEPVDFTLKEA